MRIPDDVYECIRRSMPIPCVDLVVMREDASVLLVRRTNEPAQGEWWFPGGRVHFGETRERAVARKLSEECGLSCADLRELGTFDVIFDDCSSGAIHGITTLFRIRVGSRPIRLDEQSSAAEWRSIDVWQRETLHRFVATGLRLAGNHGA